MQPAWKHAHDEAVGAGQDMYTDPATGYRVFTRLGLLRRASCCGSGCRHCPYDRQGGRRPQPRWRYEVASSGQAVDVVSWSGGKDSFLAWLSLRDEALRPAVLLTTHDADTETIAHQELPISTIEAQAQALAVDLIAVPLHPSVAYEDAIELALDMVAARFSVQRLVFGDLHLEEIRDWRVRTFSPWLQRNDAALHFPLWHADPAALLQRLNASGARATLSATPGGYGTVGQRFDAAFMASLPPQVDAFGENGEFHTRVEPDSLRPCGP